jgi:hypothetical protein
MQKTISPVVQEFKNRPFGYIVQLVGVITILANLWLVTKLFPIYKSIDEITFKVQLTQAEIKEVRAMAVTNNDLLIKFETIKVKVDDIYTRIERIDTRLSKHMGI